MTCIRRGKVSKYKNKNLTVAMARIYYGPDQASCSNMASEKLQDWIE